MTIPKNWPSIDPIAHALAEFAVRCMRGFDYDFENSNDAFDQQVYSTASELAYVIASVIVKSSGKQVLPDMEINPIDILLEVQVGDMRIWD